MSKRHFFIGTRTEADRSGIGEVEIMNDATFQLDLRSIKPGDAVTLGQEVRSHDGIIWESRPITDEEKDQIMELTSKGVHVDTLKPLLP